MNFVETVGIAEIVSTVHTVHTIHTLDVVHTKVCGPQKGPRGKKDLGAGGPREAVGPVWEWGLALFKPPNEPPMSPKCGVGLDMCSG